MKTWEFRRSWDRGTRKDLGTVFKPGLKDLVYAVPRRLAGRMTQRPPDKYQVVIQRAGILSVQLNNV